jgi:hypothetical protein
VAEVQRTLTRVDPLTLVPRGRGVELAEYHDGWSRSPSGSKIALGMGSPAQPHCGAGLCVVDLDSMRVVQDIDAPIAVEAVGWVGPRRLVGVTQGGLVMVVDPVTGATVQSRDFARATSFPSQALGAGRFAVLIGGDVPRLVVVNRSGRIRLAGLDRLGEVRMEDRLGLTIDPRAGRALVFGARGLVAAVDLRTLRVRYHRLRVSGKSAASRGRLDPANRCAEWLGGGRVVTYGKSVRVIDTRNWTARTLKARASSAAVVGNRLLAYTGRFATEGEGVGLRVYSADGERLIAHRFGDQRLNLQIAGGYAYEIAPRSVRIVRAHSGRLVHEASRRPPGFTNLFDGRSGSGFCGL